MPIHSTPSSFGTITKTFHWLTALLILLLIPLGGIAARLPYETNAELATKAWLFSMHKTLGIIVFLVALARIIWAVTQTKPASLHPDRTIESLLAEVVHWALYIALVVVPLSGWVGHAATSGFAPVWLPFGQTLPFVPKDEGIAHIMESLHWVFGKVLILAILLHVAGAVKHHVIDRDATLRRMWFGKVETAQIRTQHNNMAAPFFAFALFGIATGVAAATGFFDPESNVESAALESVASEWAVDSGNVAIAITQFGTAVSGEFADWTAAITFDPNATSAYGDVTTTIAIASLTLGSVTDQAMGADFFAAETFPTATFTSDIVASGDAYIADGTLTLKGTTIPVQLPFTLTIEGDTATMRGQTTLNRLDFGIGQSMPDETNLGFRVDVDINLTATRGSK